MIRRAIYLKFHQQSFNAYACLRWWVEVARSLGGDLFVLCDLDSQKVPEDLRGYLLRSDEVLRAAMKSKLAEKWINAGAAHLTCFAHAHRQGYEEFWNIDADDTMFLMEKDAVVRSLHAAEQVARAQQIDCFSLDMYQTFQVHWSFGVTFTRRSKDYLGIVASIDPQAVVAAYPPVNDGQPFVRKEDGLVYRLIGYNGNIDWFFTYMRDRQLINARSFYIENAYFAHVGIFGYDPLGQLINGVYHWRDGKLWDRPVMADCIKIESI